MTQDNEINIPLAFETERLFIRPFEPEDASQLYSALDESIAELREYLWFLPWVAETQTVASAEARCVNAKNNFEQKLDFAYLAFDKTSSHLIASVGFHRTDWTIPKTEIGFWVRSSEAGRGYATECVNELTDWALLGLRARRVELVTDEFNMGSRVVAERCGFQLEAIKQDDILASDGVTRNLCVYVKHP